MFDLGEREKTSHAPRATLSFSDIVGQAELKEALLAVAANDGLDGLLIQGEKGTAKSTTVRALTELLPSQEAIGDCPYGCPPNSPTRQCADCRARTDPPTVERPAPLVTLPLGATRERVVGSLSVADALGGDYEFDPGLLARANRGILYVDEVNLLDDHLVDVLLDAAASGVNRVERDGVSVSHPAAFTLVGTMNPEEGDLRPQLRDRFALQATVTACTDIDQRVEIIDRAIGRGERGVGDATDDADTPDARTAELRTRLRRARELLGDVELATEFAEEIAELCRDAGVDGHRADISTARAAMTFAALDGRPKVVESDVRRAAELALPHRMQSRPFEEASDPSESIDDHFDDERPEETTGDSPDEADDGDTDGNDGASDSSDSSEESRESDRSGEPESSESPNETDHEDEGQESPNGAVGDGEDDGSDAAGESTPSPGEAEGRTETEPEAAEGGREADESGDSTEAAPLVPGQAPAGVGEARAPELSAPEAVDGEADGDGTRFRANLGVGADGSRVRTRRAESNEHIDAAASVRAAAARGASSVESRDLRQSVRQGDATSLVLFVVDASASMRPAMRAAKGTVLELLKDAYQQRDEVAFVAFAGDEADVLLPPTDSVTLAARHLKELPTGDRTPLPAGLRTAAAVLERAAPPSSVVVLVTDGRANVAAESPVRETREAAERVADAGAHVLVVDAGDEGDRTGVTELIADATGGEHIPLSLLSADRVDATAGAVRETEL